MGEGTCPDIVGMLLDEISWMGSLEAAIYSMVQQRWYHVVGSPHARDGRDRDGIHATRTGAATLWRE